MFQVARYIKALNKLCGIRWLWREKLPYNV